MTTCVVSQRCCLGSPCTSRSRSRRPAARAREKPESDNRAINRGTDTWQRIWRAVRKLRASCAVRKTCPQKASRECAVGPVHRFAPPADLRSCQPRHRRPNRRSCRHNNNQTSNASQHQHDGYSYHAQVSNHPPKSVQPLTEAEGPAILAS